MPRRGNYLSFLRRRHRRGDFIFERQSRVSPTALLTAALLASLGLAFFAWRVSASGDESLSSPPGSVLTGEPVTTTLAGRTGTEQLGCPLEPTGWTTFQGDNQRTGCTDAPVIEAPAIAWQVDIGIQGWLNNPVVDGDRVYVGSAGNIQFEPDEADGVYAISLNSGNVLWHFHTELDVNGVAVADNVVVATGDEGKAWGIVAETAAGTEGGRPRWEVDLGVDVFSNPLIVGDVVMVGDGDGFLTAHGLQDGVRLWQVQVGDGNTRFGPIRGGAASDGERIYAVSEAGGATAMTLDGTVIWRSSVTGTDEAAEQVRVYGAPTVSGDLLLITLLRDDVSADPGIVAIDRNTGELRWRATDAASIKPDCNVVASPDDCWGNVRSSVALLGNLLVYGDPYSKGLVAVDVAGGNTRWSVDAGEFCFPHWSSAAVVAGQVILPRYDGGLYAVDAVTGEVVWRMYLGDSAAGGAFPATYSESFCLWQPEAGFPILASPAVSSNGFIIVGTLEGVLYAVADETWISAGGETG